MSEKITLDKGEEQQRGGRENWWEQELEENCYL